MNHIILTYGIATTLNKKVILFCSGKDRNVLTMKIIFSKHLNDT